MLFVDDIMGYVRMQLGWVELSWRMILACGWLPRVLKHERVWV